MRWSIRFLVLICVPHIDIGFHFSDGLKFDGVYAVYYILQPAKQCDTELEKEEATKNEQKSCDRRQVGRKSKCEEDHRDDDGGGDQFSLQSSHLTIPYFFKRPLGSKGFMQLHKRKSLNMPFCKGCFHSKTWMCPNIQHHLKFLNFNFLIIA